MALKVAVVLCLFGMTHAGNLHGGTGLGYSSNLGYGDLGHRSPIRYAHPSGLGYGSNLGYSSLGHRSNLGYGSAYSTLGYGYNGLGSQSYGGYGASASRPAISTVSVTKYVGPSTPYSAGISSPAISGTYGAHRAYNQAVSSGIGAHGYGASTYSEPAISTVSINKYLGPDTPYSGFSGHGTYAPTISGYGAHSGYAPAISNGYGYGGYGYGSGSYGNKW